MVKYYYDTKSLWGVKMNFSFLGGIMFLFLGVVLLTNPWQFFSRHDPIMIKISSSKKYRGYVKALGYILVLSGFFLETIALFRFLF